MKAFNLSAWALNNRALVLFLMLALGVAGVASYGTLGRAEDPTFTIKTMVIKVFWPGADAREVERQVTDRIEKKLQEVPHFDYASSFSKPGEATIEVKLMDTTPPEDVPDLWYQVRKKVGDMRATLPVGIIGPFFNDEFGDTYGNIYAVSGDGFDMGDLKDYLEDIRQRLLAVPDVAKVEMLGVQEERIFVEVSHRHLATYGLTAEQVADSLRRQNIVTATGVSETQSSRVFLRVSGEFDGVDAVRAVPIEIEGQLLRLSDIAEVRAGFVDPPVALMRFKGEPVLGLAVSMKEGGDILRLGENLEAAVAEIEADLPIGISIAKVADQPTVVDKAINEFLLKLCIALGVVLLISFLSLGLRAGLVVALAVPLVLGITFMLMHPLGIGLQRISLGALIISLGLLVDDAIIAVEMMIVKMESGWKRAEAASYAWEATAMPMLSGTLITVAGFIPVGFAASTAGEYTNSIFWVVGGSLLVSWFVAVVFTPYLGVKLLPDYAKHGHGDDKPEGPLMRAFRRLVVSCVRFRWPVILGTVALFASAIVTMQNVEKQFFPSSSRPEVLVNLDLPEGSSIEATLREVERLEDRLDTMPLVVSYSSFVGEGAPRFYLPLDPILPRENFAQFVIMTEGSRESQELLDQLRQLVSREFSDIRVRVQRLENGPPVGYPVQFRVLGKDPDRVRRIAEEVRNVTATNVNTYETHMDWNERVRSVKIEVDQDKARLLGLTSDDISRTLQTLHSGYAVTQYREGIDLIDVVIRAIPEERVDLANLDDINLRSRSGANIPLSQVARITYQLEEGIIWRRSRDVVITVRADVVGNVQPATVTAAIEPLLEPIVADLPAGYRIETGGAVEESAKGEASIAALLPVVVIVVMTLLMIQLGSFSTMLLVLATAPLGIIGVAYTLLVFNVPLGFVSILGVIALSGMIIRNSVILVDQIDQDIKAGQQPFEAVIDSTIRRTRPIVLTALAAILAFVPLTQSDFWGPMAYAIIGGLTVATVLTLLFAPALYAAWFRIPSPDGAGSEAV